MANKVPYDVNSVSPVVYKDLVIFSIYEKGIGAIRLSKSGDRLVPQEVWRNTAYESYMNTPVLAGNRLAGFSYKKKGQFFCLDADTGKLLWESAGRMGENVAILNAGSLFFFLNDEAKLFVEQRRRELRPGEGVSSCRQPHLGASGAPGKLHSG